MSRSINHNLRPWLWLLLFLLVCVVVSVCTGCNPQKKINKAISTVLTDSTAFDSVGRVHARLNPCINDTATIYKEGALRIENEFIELPGDTIRTSDTVYIINTTVNTRTRYKTDTAFYTITDRKAENLALKKAAAEREARWQEIGRRRTAEHTNSNKSWWIAALIAFIVLRELIPFLLKRIKLPLK